MGTRDELPLSRQLALMRKALRQSGRQGRVAWLAASILVVILATTYGQVVLNRWNIPFYDAIQRRDLTGFIGQLKIFGVIASALLVLNVTQTWLDKFLSLTMREGITRDLIRQWMTDRRAVRLSTAGAIGINPDQRLQEDTGVLAEMTTSLTIGFVQAGIQLASFVGVLWMLSSGFSLTFRGNSIALPGYMVWAAFLYSGLASLLIWLVGHRLVGLNTERYAREAEFRTSLMRTNEHLVAISLAHGEPREQGWIEARFNRLLDNLWEIVRAQLGLKWVSSGYGWLSQVVPIIIAAPMYFAGNISFGGLMMAVSAFNHVISSLRWYMDNFASIAIWRATLFRVSAFREALEAMDAQEPAGQGLTRLTDPEGRIVLEDFGTRPAVQGATDMEGVRVAERTVTVEPGEHVVFDGDRSVNHRSLFLALAGLSPSAQGLVTLPPPEEMLFLQKEGFVPEGRLSEVLAYPLSPAPDDAGRMTAALSAVGLDRLTGSLDREERWHRMLEADDRMRLLFANLLVREPACVVMEDVLDGLEPDTARQVLAALLDQGSRTILYFGSSAIFTELAKPRLVALSRVGGQKEPAGQSD